jgi:hypothetical protein
MRVRMLLTTVLLTGLAAVVPTAPSYAATASLRSTAPYGKAMAGEGFTLTGRLSTGFARKVVLQYHRGSRWVDIRSKRTGNRGRFTFTGVRQRDTRTYRAYAPAVRHDGRRYGSTRTPGCRVRRVVQTGRAAALPKVSQPSSSLADPDRATATGYALFTPRRPGRKVAVQRQVRGRWVTFTTVTENADGAATFDRPDSGTAAYRAIAQPFHGSGTKTTSRTVPHWGRPVFGDSFTDGSTLGSTWRTRATAPAPQSHRECSVGDPRMTTMDPADGGRLLLSAAVDTSQGTCTWTDKAGGQHLEPHHYLNGHVGTQGRFSFRYGVAAARVRFQRPTGMHASFWLQAVASAVGTSEVDTVEFFGQNYDDDPLGAIGNYVHYGNRKYGRILPDAQRFVDAGSRSWWSRYHVFSVHWSPAGYVFLVDGREMFATENGISQDSEFLVLSLLTSDYELARLPDPELTEPPAMSVDWVRVWQDPTVAGSLLNGSPAPTP